MSITFVAAASGPADNGDSQLDPRNVALPTGAQSGDLLIYIAENRTAAVTQSMFNQGGQTWTPLAQLSTTNLSGRVFWCRYNGTLGGNGSIGATSNGPGTGMTGVMIALRPTSPSYTWAVDVALASVAYAAPTTPFTVTVTGQTPSATKNVVTVAIWFSTDDNTWINLSGSGWSQSGLSAQYRNLCGGNPEISLAVAYNIQGIGASATGNVSLSQSAQAGDNGLTAIVTFAEVPAGPWTVAVGQVSETDIAQAAAHLKTRSVSQATETDLAQTVSARKTRLVAQTSEADAAQSMSAQRIRSVGQPSESDTAQTFAHAKLSSVAQVSEFDVAQSVARLKRALLAQPSEADLAQPIAHAKLRLVGQASETDEAQFVLAAKILALALATELDVARAVNRLRFFDVGLAEETDAAQAAVRSGINVLLGTATEADVAILIGHALSRGVGCSVETDLAHAIRARVPRHHFEIQAALVAIGAYVAAAWPSAMRGAVVVPKSGIGAAVTPIGGRQISVVEVDAPTFGEVP